MIKDYMMPKEWVQACGTCSTTYKLRTILGEAELSNFLGNAEQDLARQLRVDKWPSCHSLYFKLRKMYGVINVTEEQIKQIKQAGRMLPLLQCLHIIGSSYYAIGDVAKVKSSVEALLMEALAPHVSVLTLRVHVVGVPLNLPNLQHLVLHLLPTSQGPYDVLFPQNESLKSLKTLCVRSNGCYNDMGGPLDLRGCAQLQHVALRKVTFRGVLTLPAGCLLHVFSDPSFYECITPSIRSLITGLTLRHDGRWSKLELSSLWSMLRRASSVRNLKVLQLILSRDMLERHSLWDSMSIDFGPDVAPRLEVLEVYVHSSLSIYIDPILPLERIVIHTAGHLVLRHLCHPLAGDVSRGTLKHLYLESGAPLCPNYDVCLEGYYMAKSWPGAQMRLLRHYKGQQNGWTLQMPVSFTPRMLQECCCNACPGCLVRAGVPILCDRAWTYDGF